MKREMRELTPRELAVLRKRGLNPPSGPVEVITVFESRDPVDMMRSDVLQGQQLAEPGADISTELGEKTKPCLREPIPEILDAARYLDAAVSAHSARHTKLADELIRLTNTSVLREYINSLWGSNSPYVRVSNQPDSPAYLLKKEKTSARMPGAAVMRQIVERDGYHCRFCNIPVIPAAVRTRMAAAYPDALPWGNSNATQHAAFQVMWLQYDHIIPYARGGASSLENMVVACAGCNYSRMNWTLEEVGMLNPRCRDPVRSLWDGLMRFV